VRQAATPFVSWSSKSRGTVIQYDFMAYGIVDASTVRRLKIDRVRQVGPAVGAYNAELDRYGAEEPKIARIDTSGAAAASGAPL